MNDVIFPADVVQFTVSRERAYLTVFGETEVTLDHINVMRSYLDNLERVKFVKQESPPVAQNPSGYWFDGDIVQVDPAYEQMRPGALVVVTDVRDWQITGFPMVPAWPEGKTARLNYSKYHTSWCGHLKWPRLLWQPNQGNPRQ